MLTDIRKRPCDHCGEMFRPRYPTQRFCRRWCRLQGKAAEARAARRTWWKAGRPMEVDGNRIVEGIKYGREPVAPVVAENGGLRRRAL